jgi:putative membrane protein
VGDDGEGNVPHEKEEEAMYWNFGWGWGMGIGCIATFLLWILIILGIVFLVRAILRSERKGTAEETALDILKKRYARGEIGREEFEEKRKDIQ